MLTCAERETAIAIPDHGAKVNEVLGDFFVLVGFAEIGSDWWTIPQRRGVLI